VKKIVIVAALGFTISGNAFSQETYYVSDQLTITLRTGEGIQKKIIRTLKSGTKLEITETHEDTGYSYVKTEEGTEGWVLTRFLVKNPVARHRLKEAQKTIKKLKAETKELKNKFKQISSEHHQLDENATKLKKQNDRLSQELKQIRNISASAIANNEENKNLKTNMIRLETEIQALEQQTAVLKDRSARDWFITGTGVTVLGLLIGLLIPKIRLEKKRNWNEL
jgi:SH3 domain protein